MGIHDCLFIQRIVVQTFLLYYLLESLLVVNDATYLFPPGVGLVSQESADIVRDLHPLGILGDLEAVTCCVHIQESELGVIHEAIERVLVAFEGSDEVLSIDLVL
jgi:hypothetical protein